MAGKKGRGGGARNRRAAAARTPPTQNSPINSTVTAGFREPSIPRRTAHFPGLEPGLKNEARDMNRPRRQEGIRKAKIVADARRGQAGQTTGRRAMRAATQPSPGMGRRTKVGLALGGAAAIGVLMNRSGSPSDRGRQSTYRY
jgi:hypothetical protein